MPFLIRAVESIINQEYSIWELIIVDDGSRDGTKDYLHRHILPTDARVRYIEHSTNKGIASAYNTGIREARGRFLAFQEQDDISLPERLAVEVGLIEKHEIPFVTSRVGWINADGRIFKYWPTDFQQDLQVLDPSYNLYCDLVINQTCFSNAATMLDRGRIRTEDLLFDETFRRSGQDWDLHLRLVTKYPTMRIMQPLVHMSRHPGHTSSTSDKRTVFEGTRILLKKHWLFHRELTGKPDWGTFRRAWSNQFLLEARYFKGIRGLALGLLSAVLWPTNLGVWESFRNTLRRS